MQLGKLDASHSIETGKRTVWVMGYECLTESGTFFDSSKEAVEVALNNQRGITPLNQPVQFHLFCVTTDLKGQQLDDAVHDYYSKNACKREFNESPNVISSPHSASEWEKIVNQHFASLQSK